MDVLCTTVKEAVTTTSTEKCRNFIQYSNFKYWISTFQWNDHFLHTFCLSHQFQQMKDSLETKLNLYINVNLYRNWAQGRMYLMYIYCKDVPSVPNLWYANERRKDCIPYFTISILKQDQRNQVECFLKVPCFDHCSIPGILFMSSAHSQVKACLHPEFHVLTQHRGFNM